MMSGQKTGPVLGTGPPKSDWARRIFLEVHGVTMHDSVPCHPAGISSSLGLFRPIRPAQRFQRRLIH